MELILTSFGVSHLDRGGRQNTNIFYRMPPASLASAGQEFMPDYAALLVADRIIIDQKTYDLLMTGRHESYGNVALTAKALYDEGFVRLEDFDSIIAKNREVLEAMLERDMKELDSWIVPLKDSVAEWRRFSERFRGSLRDDFVESQFEDHGQEGREFYEHVSFRMATWLHGLDAYTEHAQNLVTEALLSSRKRRGSDHRQALRDVLAEYLSYVNANILLSNELSSGFYDWCDFRPFYRDKFLRVARLGAPGQSESDSVRKLFEVSFPEFTFWTPDGIIRALKDKRIGDLRQLVQSAVKGDVKFDREFANRTLTEVLKVEKSIGKMRNFVSYLTAPLHFIPKVGVVVQKAVEEAVAHPIAHKLRKDYQWFYLISELGDRFRPKP